MDVYTLTLRDEAYPKRLATIYDPPRSLRVRGAFSEQDDIAVALVGSRRASHYGMQSCETLAYELAIRGITIVSGLARGIDTAAHRGALKAQGRTIAVLGSGHANIYPPENAGLYQEISASGAVISEFEDDMPPFRQNFPQRNRIISGLSLGVVVVEASQTSGALITASYALEQGREVFAVPGKIDSLTSRGTHDLIKDGAKLIQSAQDIIDELGLKPVVPHAREETSGGEMKETLDELEQKVYGVLSDEPLHLDDVYSRTGLELGELSRVLLQLELKRLIKALPGKRFITL